MILSIGISITTSYGTSTIFLISFGTSLMISMTFYFLQISISGLESIRDFLGKFSCLIYSNSFSRIILVYPMIVFYYTI